jgi:hypothetical protein
MNDNKSTTGDDTSTMNDDDSDINEGRRGDSNKGRRPRRQTLGMVEGFG